MRFLKHGNCFTSSIPTTTASIAVLATMLVVTPAGAFAAIFSPVDFSSQANFTWVTHAETDPDGATAIYFPGGPVGQVTLGGIPFNIKSNAAGNQAWNAYVAAGSTGESANSTPESITIPVGNFGVTDVYTLINTYWDSAGSLDASLIFTGSGGATYTKQLVGDSDIRNWFDYGPGDSINGTSTANVYNESQSPINGGAGVLDMQHIALPTAFATQTLSTIQLVDDGATGIQRAIIDGVTVESVPEPASLSLFGIGALTLLSRRRQA